MKNFDKYIYYKTQTINEKSTSHCWYLINKETREGVHFHGTKYENPDGVLKECCNRFNFYAMGLEAHRTKPIYSDHTPIKGHCLVTLGDCYHDGSSLQAGERLGHINPDGSNDEHVWNILHAYYGYWIERADEEINTNQKQSVEEKGNE